MKRHATAVWSGSGKEGNGTLSTQSTVLTDSQYSYKTRFEDGAGTNPEELIAAAHAGCFNMKLAFVLNAAGYTAERLETKCIITLDPASGITSSQLTLSANVPEISQADFDAAVADAEANCPVSQVLNAEISVEATLN